MSLKQNVQIGFIGAGKAGLSFGKYITEKTRGTDGGFSVSGYAGRGPASSSAEEAADFTGSRAFDSYAALVSASDLILLTVPDGAIAGVWDELRKVLPPAKEAPAKYIGHMSGSMGSEVFRGAAGLSCAFGSLHPMAALFDKQTAYRILISSYFTIEGDGAFLELASALFRTLGNSACVIAADKKPLYHTAAATLSNLTAALAYAGMEMYRACGLPENFAGNAWRPLFLENARNIIEVGPVNALTGPLERGDAETVAKHLNALRGNTRPESAEHSFYEAYRALSRILLEVASEKHPDRDYAALKKLLEDNPID
ncbi:MAG: DUF2520 domain-containing protein [Clostridiales Family XIII bacterium]|jgi:predicted short-subunit dehydrogenase-like oxidoreductase (DUF2520 family)|nr:DUF2520 domain-containing protein [Clostridiales Family XIII bacterium]